MADIKRLSPDIVHYRIHFIEKATPKRDLQRRLNPIMQEVVHAEILKLLDNEIFIPYLIASGSAQSTRFSKKSGFTVIENEKKELV